MKRLLMSIAAIALCISGMAQRITDRLDRGLIAQKTSSGVFLSWRIPGEEYYDVQYHVYKNGTKLTEQPIDVSNYSDQGGTVNDQYAVAAVVRGTEQPKCAAVKAWSTSYKEIQLTHEGIASTLIPNDACCADVDGDGEVEILMKFDNESEMAQSYPKAGPTVNGKVTGEYSIFEILKQNGQRLWWVNCGPNMGDFQNNEQNIVGYDWNCDGKAEVIMRLEEGSTIHMADGSTYVIGANGQNGSSWTNYRAATGGGTNWFMCVGKEFLVYCDGETGKVNDIIDYPLARLEPGETDLNAAWGDGYGHRASKFFFGAPYLDGKKPSIFLARGIYTQIKMCAFDVNPATNKLVKRWDWRQNSGGYWMWQGYHNFGVADVDWDGRDEIVYGSMVIDDNGKGLSTTGLGHGDAQHCGDFNPYIHGQEIYACNEDQPGNNYRDATTSKLYHRFESGNDDGRAMAGNFCNDFPGGQGCSAREGLISLVYNKAVPGLDKGGVNTNFRIYWDGDLLEETFNYRNGKNTEGVVAKYGSWDPIYIASGSMTNNDTKGTPCYQGDILGDWREEIIMRTAANNIRIYSTPTPTQWRIPSLWADHQYRQAMVWQMCGYNQPPHASFYLGELEKITVAPPPYTNTDRELVEYGGTIGAGYNGKHVLVYDTKDNSVILQDGAAPSVLTINVPSWVQGTAGTNYTAKDAKINYTYFTCNVTGGGLAGDARLVKQGDGILNLPAAAFNHTGNTDIWAGTLNFNGTMKNSALWLNRFAVLSSDGGEFKSITADYGSKLMPGGADKKGTITSAGDFKLGFGSRVVLDLYGSDITSDCIKAKTLTIEKKTGTAWTTYGPEYIQPVIEIVGHDLVAGDYVIAEAEEISGSVASLKLEGTGDFKTGIKYENGKVILSLGSTRGASEIVWSGATSATWDFANAKNFYLASDTEKTPDFFVSGDAVEFNDNAQRFTVNVTGNLTPGSYTVNNSENNYTIQGSGSITSGSFTKDGEGTVTISTDNSYTDGNYLKGGTVAVTKLSNSIDPTGNLGGVTTTAAKFTMENGAVLKTTGNVSQGSPMKMVGTEGGVINNANDFQMNAAFSGTKLTKTGSGWLKIGVAGSVATLVVKQGVVDGSAKVAGKIIAEGGADLRGSTFLTTPIEVATGANAKLTTVNRATTNLALTGDGKITVWCATEKGSNYYATRTPIQLNLANFSGTLYAEAVYPADKRFTFDTANGGDKWTLNIPADRIVQNSGKTLRIGQLAGTGELGGGCAFSNGTSVPANTWKVGNDNDFTYAGTVIASDNFEKMGNGKMTVSGVWTNTGSTKISAGELKMSSGSLIGKGALTVAAGATLSGVTKSGAPLTNSSSTINGTLQVGLTATGNTGNFDFNAKNVTFGTAGVLMLNVNKAVAEADDTKLSGTHITNINKLTMNGTITLNIANSYTPAQGDVFRLWNKVTTFAGTPKFDLPESHTNKDGVTYLITWDTSKISEGIVKVANATIDTRIESVIASSENVEVRVTALNGTAVCQYFCPMSEVQAELRKSGITTGIYLLQIKSESGKTKTMKVMK